MANVNTQSCDVCGTLKKESNNWYRAKGSDGRFLLTHWSDRPWESQSQRRILATQHLHLCGIGCAVKAMTEAMRATPSGKVHCREGEGVEEVTMASREDLQAVGYTGI
jgi:hypothetical protein